MNTNGIRTSGLDERVRRGGWSFVRVAARTLSFWWPFLSPIAMAEYSPAQTTRPVPSVETIVARMSQARADNQVRFRAYVVTRDYKFFGKERQKTKYQAIADVTFVPPDSKKYAIQQAKGSGLGETVVRRMLASEVSMAKDCTSTDFSLRNYDFRFIREETVDDHRCYVLELLPRRKEKSLLRGNIWVDTNTYLLHRIEGELAKSPSWWLRDVRIASLYGSVGGMWLQTTLEATATVRILGPYTMIARDMSYSVDELISEISPALEGIRHTHTLGAAATTSDTNPK